MPIAKCKWDALVLRASHSLPAKRYGKAQSKRNWANAIYSQKTLQKSSKTLMTHTIGNEKRKLNEWSSLFHSFSTRHCCHENKTLMMMVVKSTSVCLRGPVLMLLCISTGGHCTDDKVVLERNKFFYPMMMIICHHDSFFTGQFISMNK